MAPTPPPPTRGRRRAAKVAVVAVVLAVTWFVSAGCLASLGARTDTQRLAYLSRESVYREGRFENTVPRRDDAPGLKTLSEFFTTQVQKRPPAPLPLEDPRAAWEKPPERGLRITWLGHSSVLIEIDGYRVLTDPVWADRASPSQRIGPLRFHPVLVSLGELPKLDAVIISHDHYDHLCMQTVQALAQRKTPFFVPLGVADHLRKWGVRPEQIIELDWWGEGKIDEGKLRLVSTPARHFSGRSLTDRNRTLWTSWVVRTEQHRVYFSGDTGLTPQFEQIRERQGPFDVVMLEVGAFHPSWGDIHLGPDGAVEAHRMLGGGALLPIHWGTFDLGLHAWDAPGERLMELAQERQLPLITPKLGHPLEIPPREQLDAWWRGVRDP